MSIYLNIADTPSEHLLAPPLKCIELSDDTPISYKANGEVASRFGDDCWDFSAISPSYRFLIFDREDLPTSIKKEIKTLTYARLYWSPTVRSISSIRTTPLNSIGKWAKLNNKSIEQTLNDPRLHIWLATSVSALPRREAESIASLVSEITKIRVGHPELTIAPTEFKLAILLGEVARKTPSKETKQTALIPTRIYAEIIASFEELLNNFNANEKGIIEFFKTTSAGLLDGGETHVSAQAYKKWYKQPENYNKLINELGLTNLVEQYNLRDKKRWNRFARDVQNTAKYWIHLFTGMRDEEVNTLNRDCLISIETKGSTAKAITGYTSKTIGSGASNTYWITSDIIDIGIKSAQLCGELFSIQNNWKIHPTDYPLFPSINVLGDKDGDFHFHKNAPYCRALGGKRHKEWLEIFPKIIVQESDLAELYAFDGFRRWDLEIKINEPWPLSTHQCRRSLAVYLSRSGLVSMGSMQLQFKHLLISMTRYYRRNSEFSKNFILNDAENQGHQSQLNFINTIESERAISQFLAYEENVLNNLSNLWGGEGTRIKMANEKIPPLAIVTHRKKLKNSFLKGDASYKKSPLGGCTHLSSCEKLSVTQIGSRCIGCAEFVGDETSKIKAEKALSLLYRTRDKYPPESLHYRQTQAEILSFEAKLNQAKTSK